MHIGIDLGGTKTEIVVLDTNSKTILRRRVASARDSYADTLNTLLTLIATAEDEVSAHCSIGIGIPGAISPDTGLIKNANSTWLIGHNLANDLRHRLGRPVAIANDADCFTLSESIDGAAKEKRLVFGVILGTGVGGGIVFNQQLLGGPNAISGEWGHNPLPYPQPLETPGHHCYCGRQGCIETWLSGPALERQYLVASGNEISGHEFHRALTSNDLHAMACIQTYADRLARGLATIINILDPDVIVLGGGLSNIDQLYKITEQMLPQYVFSDQVNTRIVKNIHGDSSGVRGAAWLGAKLLR